ncbi:MAG TPA: rhomboid family intramembrane serine protease [Verrucomicrobiae bacterium]|nr:rhomboid family intramembrane serine protease [Verrucomicrobiae bacterium]
MLEDRDYMRAPADYRPQVSFTIAILVVNAIVFLIQLVAAHTPDGLEAQDQYFALSLAGLKHGFVWQLLTFQLMHSTFDWMHIVLNSLAIYFFGRPVELALGRRHFLTLYLTSGVIGGLVQILFTALGIFNDIPVVGASAGAYGLVAAFAMLHWREKFTLFIYFFPVSMTGKLLLAVSLGLAFIGMLLPSSNVANAAHIGGILAGAYYVRLFIQGQWMNWKFPTPRDNPPRKLVTTRTAKGSLWRSAAKPDEDLPTDEFLSSEVDPILEKISAHGIHSLTAREREILEAARKKMTRR